MPHILRDTFPEMRNVVTVGAQEHLLAHELRKPEFSIDAWHLNIYNSVECEISRAWPGIWVGNDSFFGKRKFDVVLLLDQMQNTQGLAHYSLPLVRKGGHFVISYIKPEKLGPYKIEEDGGRAINMKRFKMLWNMPLSVYKVV